jgi:hypothetical protein
MCTGSPDIPDPPIPPAPPPPPTKTAEKVDRSTGEKKKKKRGVGNLTIKRASENSGSNIPSYGGNTKGSNIPK